MDHRQELLKMLEQDGVSDQRALAYVNIFTKVENESFINGRRFEVDGKGSVLPGLSGLAGDASFTEWHREYTKHQEEDIENYNS